MIGRLHGQLVYKQPPYLMLATHGVGYELEASLSTFYQLPEVGAEVTLYTHLSVRDDAHLLYAFASLSERSLFRSLIKVNGVGAKLALLILSGMNVDMFTRCVQEGDSAALTRLPGIGKKTAERLVMEMRDRVHEVLLGPGRVVDPAGNSAGTQPSAVDDAISALVALGYKLPDATRMVRNLDTDTLSSEEIIRSALQSVVQR